MARTATFGQKVGAGFAATLLLALMLAAVAIVTLRSVVASKDRVISLNSHLLIDAEKLRGVFEGKSAAGRAFLLTREERFVLLLREARADLAVILDGLRRSVYTPEGKRLIEAVARSEREHNETLDAVIDLRRRGGPLEEVIRAFDDQVKPKRDQLSADLNAFVARAQQLLEEANHKADGEAARGMTLLMFIGGAAVLVASLVALGLARTLTRQIGSSVGQVRSSSAELQSSANQQATGAKEQATAMNEITTTISELLATSRQIAESAQRVAHVADQTAGAARNGDGTIERAQDSIGAIRRQMDAVVGNMLELGKKSQQIGSVVDIVAELAEQTNILAINATIEAAGAGEAGRRFAVVADEIRKLADRVAVAAKDIRGLVDDVRGSVNATVMATETGSKAVDSGTKQFGDVASSFKQIGALVSTTTEAAREIELSTKQQTTAVEQVNLAIASVAQATRENEASSVQTLQTASQLTNLSRELMQLIQRQPHPAA